MSDSQAKSPPPYPALAAALEKIPGTCGVYLFKDAGGRVLYVGKAVNLKNRVGSYLKNDKQRPKTGLLLKKAARVDFLLTATEREALILERNLIKEHRPRFNVMLRDDKNFLCLRLDWGEEYPGLRFVRQFAADGAMYFGPYSSAGMARETLKVMKRAFGVRTCKERRLQARSRPCLEFQVQQCLGPCAGQVSAEDYRRAVADAVMFLKGRARNLLRQLKGEMDQAAAGMDFEKAAVLRDRIRSIQETLERQDMARPSSKDQDVVGLAAGEGRAVVLVLQVRAGLVTGSREYYFPEPPAPDELLPGFVKQYYVEGRPVPDEILLPGDIADRRLLAEVLSEQKGGPVRLMAASRGERGRLLALAGDNARAAWERRRPARSPEEALADLKTRLRLPGEAHRLEGVDISTLQGSQSVGGLVRFIDGEPDKSGYRRFRIKGVAGQDDYAMLAEVVRRHYGKPGQARPDLLVVDGGRGQLAAVLEALKDAGAATFPVVALAKETEQAGQRVRDRVFLPGRKNPRFLPPNSPGLLLLLRLRDEAHRFAISYHRKRARKELLTSELRQIPGIGPVRLKRLLQHFPNLEVLKSATLEDLSAVPGFNRGVAEKLKEWILEEGQEAQERV